MVTGSEVGIAAAAQVVLTIAGVVIKDVFHNKSMAKKVESMVGRIKSEAPVIETDMHKSVDFVKRVLEEPAIAARLAPLEHRAKDDLKALRTTKLYQWASVAVQAHLKQFQDLTPDEVASAVQYVQTQLSSDAQLVKEGAANFTSGEILAAFKDMAAASQKFRESTLFQQTQQLIATKAQLAQEASTPVAKAASATKAAPAPAPAKA